MNSFIAKTTEANYSGGVLRPLEPLPFREEERVRITVEPVGMNGVGASTDRRALIAGFERMRLRSGGRMPMREELHER